MTTILKGAPVVQAINKQLSSDVTELKASGIFPTLAIVRVGERADDLSYEQNSTKRLESLGIQVKKYPLPIDISEKSLICVIKEINHDSTIHGALLFKPLPKHIDETIVCNMLNPDKDVDGITNISMAGVFSNTAIGYPPCTPSACMEILDYYGIDPAGKNAVVIGRSLVVGKPVAMMLIKKNATVTICHTKTKNPAKLSAAADILIVAAGHAKMIGKSYFNPEQIIIDVGININEEGKLCGDVDFEEANKIAAAVTPVPGGVGTVTTSVLAKHVVAAAKKYDSNPPHKKSSDNI